MQEKETIGTPNAIWEWRCRDCRVEYNEGYLHRFSRRGRGRFDIDYGDENNLLNTTSAMTRRAIAFLSFGAEGQAGTRLAARFGNKTCIHNGRSPRFSKRQGAVFLYTWNGGKLDGVEIENNVIVWDPPVR